MSPTHVEMSGVEPLKEADVIETLSLEEEENERKHFGRGTNINTQERTKHKTM